jgi:hypothetical protein
MLHGTPAASVDPVALDEANSLVKSMEEAEEQRKRDELAQQQEQAKLKKDVEQQKQNQDNTIGSKIKAGLRGGIEVPTALVGGTIDFADSIGERYNLPWLDFPDNWTPQNKTPWGKALRTISELAVPSLSLAALTRTGVTAGLGRVVGPEKVASTPWVIKLLGNSGIEAASGLAVDAVSRQSEDHNALGILKKNFFPWIPDNIATLDSDSPDVKRQKNMVEGVGANMAIDLLGAIIKGSKSIMKVADGVQFRPKDEVAQQYFAQATAKADPTDAGADHMIKASGDRERVLDDWAEQQYAKDPDGLEGPHPAVNSPLYDDHEKAVLGVRQDAVAQNLVDGVRIQRNIGTENGRMATIITESAQKNGLEVENLQQRTLVQDVQDSIRATGEFDATINGIRMTKKEMVESADYMLKEIINPNKDVDSIKKLFVDRRGVEGISQVSFINDIQYNAAMQGTKRLIDQYIGLDTARASARIQTTMAGEVADIAEGARIMGDAIDTSRQQEMIFDKIEYLMSEMGINKYISGWLLNNKKTWEATMKSGDPESIARFAQEAEAEISAATAERIARAKEFIATMKEIKETNPNFLRPLIEAYELTNGKVDTIDKLNRWYQNSTGVLRKAVIDGDPEVPSVVMQGVWGTIYNSVLSATLTPMKAFANNITVLMSKPVTILGGAAIGGDVDTFKRSIVQFGNVGEHLQKAMEHAGDVFRKVANDPNSVTYGMDDIATKNADTFMVLENYAKAKAAQGEYGPQAVVGIAKALKDFNDHPWVRYSANLMTAGDAFVRSFMANFEARGRAYDEMIAKYGDVNYEGLREAQSKVYAEMFDETGLITDKAVEHASREVAMNLDSPAVKGISAILARFPAMKPFIMFPRTSMNILNFAHKHSPLALAFGESNRILTATTPAEINEIMKSRGITEFTDQQWKQVVAETKGRIALGTITTLSATMLYLSGGLTGNGPYDKEANRAKVKSGWVPRSIRNPITGEWHSYEAFEPFATYLALVADIGDNVNQLGTATTEDLYSKLAFAFSMNITNKSFLSGLTPMTDMLAGNEAGFQRFVANQVNNMLPYAGLRNQLGQLMYPGLREVDNEFHQQLVRNRNAWVDLIDPAGALPYARDFIDGSRIRDYEPMTNIMNNLLPFKTNPSAEPYRKWLMDTGFQAMPILKKSSAGIEYSPRERELIGQYMGEYGNLPTELTKLMRRKDLQRDLQFYKTARRDLNVSSEDLNLAKSRVHREIQRVFRTAQARAEAIMYSNYPKLRRDAQIKSLREKAQVRGDYNAVQQLIQINK